MMVLKELLALAESSPEAEAEAVLQDLLNFDPDIKVDAETQVEFKADIGRKLKAGWTATEVRRYLRCTEEFSPDLDEDRALKKMKAIKDAVEDRLKGEKK